MTDQSVVYGICLTLAGILVWSIRQEGRINEHDQPFAEREKQVRERQASIIARLDRIDVKLDNAAATALTTAAAAAKVAP